MKQNLPHPQATQPILEAEGTEDRSQCLMKVYGPILVTLFNLWHGWDTHTGRLCVWNWKLGTLLYVSPMNIWFIFTHQVVIAIRRM
jgi:hypothetical protein